MPFRLSTIISTLIKFWTTKEKGWLRRLTLKDVDDLVGIAWEWKKKHYKLT